MDEDGGASGLMLELDLGFNDPVTFGDFSFMVPYHFAFQQKEAINENILMREIITEELNLLPEEIEEKINKLAESIRNEMKTATQF